MEKTDEIKRYLKFQKKLRVLKLGGNLGCRYVCEVKECNQNNVRRDLLHGEFRQKLY